MFKKIRSVSKIKKKTDKKVTITLGIENWPRKSYRPDFWDFFRLFQTVFKIVRISISEISQTESTVLFTSHTTLYDFLVHDIEKDHGDRLRNAIFNH